jgi:hypothetical protein
MSVLPTWLTVYGGCYLSKMRQEGCYAMYTQMKRFHICIYIFAETTLHILGVGSDHVNRSMRGTKGLKFDCS